MAQPYREYLSVESALGSRFRGHDTRDWQEGADVAGDRLVLRPCTERTNAPTRKSRRRRMLVATTRRWCGVTMPEAQAAWYTDPSARHRLRYWDGARWTAFVSDGGETAIDELAPAPPATATVTTTAAVAEGLEHAIIKLTSENGVETTRLVLTDTTRSMLEASALNSQLAFLLDLVTEEQVTQLCESGRTETTDSLGRRHTVTVEFCACRHPASHKRPGVTSLGG